MAAPASLLLQSSLSLGLNIESLNVAQVTKLSGSFFVVSLFNQNKTQQTKVRGELQALQYQDRRS
jgi:hypothetical protein